MINNNIDARPHGNKRKVEGLPGVTDINRYLGEGKVKNKLQITQTLFPLK